MVTAFLLLHHARAAPRPGGATLAEDYHVGEVDVPALRDVDFDLYEGESLILLGASGSGKSTRLNILGGLDVPIAGRVFYRDLELTHADEAALIVEGLGLGERVITHPCDRVREGTKVVPR